MRTYRDLGKKSHFKRGILVRRRLQLDCHIWENSPQASVWIEQEWSIKTGTVIQENNTETVFALKIGIEN